MARLTAGTVLFAGLCCVTNAAAALSLQDDIRLTQTPNGVIGTYYDELGNPNPCVQSEGSSTNTSSIYVSDEERIISFSLTSGKPGEFTPLERVPPGNLMGRVNSYYPDDYGTVLLFKGIFLTSQVGDELSGSMELRTNNGCTFFYRIHGVLDSSWKALELIQAEAEAKAWITTGDMMYMLSRYIIKNIVKPLVDKPEGGLKEGVEVKTLYFKKKSAGGVRG